jgi:hypothetical protein
MGQGFDLPSGEKFNELGGGCAQGAKKIKLGTGLQAASVKAANEASQRYREKFF